jgi:phage gpG-like protein
MVRIGFDYSDVQKFIGDWNAKLPIVHKTALKRIGEEVVKLVQTKWLTGQSLNVRSGRLRKSIDYVFEGAHAIRVGTNVEYGAIHEYGGTIRPKNVRFLTIPLTHVAERAVGGATAMNLFVWSPGGWGETAFLASATARRLTLHWLLAREVTIPRRPWLNPAIQYYVHTDQAERAIRWAIKTVAGSFAKDMREK